MFKLSRKIFLNRTIIVGFILIVLIIFFGVATPKNVFISWPSISTILKVTPQFALMTIGLGLILIVGEIDLSIGSIYAFSSVIFKVRVCDTAGAGDMFGGAFTYGLLQKWNLKKIATFANAVAAFGISHTRENKYPTRSKIEKLLQEANT